MPGGLEEKLGLSYRRVRMLYNALSNGGRTKTGIECSHVHALPLSDATLSREPTYRI